MKGKILITFCELDKINEICEGKNNFVEHSLCLNEMGQTKILEKPARAFPDGFIIRIKKLLNLTMPPFTSTGEYSLPFFTEGSRAKIMEVFLQSIRTFFGRIVKKDFRIILDQSTSSSFILSECNKWDGSRFECLSKEQIKESFKKEFYSTFESINDFDTEEKENLLGILLTIKDFCQFHRNIENRTFLPSITGYLGVCQNIAEWLIASFLESEHESVLKQKLQEYKDLGDIYSALKKQLLRNPTEGAFLETIEERKKLLRGLRVVLYFADFVGNEKEISEKRNSFKIQINGFENEIEDLVFKYNEKCQKAAA
jgi:hypothetical protein